MFNHWFGNDLRSLQENLKSHVIYLYIQVRHRQKYYTTQFRPDWASKSRPSDHDSVFHVPDPDA